jgi:hypothetical protein
MSLISRNIYLHGTEPSEEADNNSFGQKNANKDFHAARKFIFIFTDTYPMDFIQSQ